MPQKKKDEKEVFEFLPCVRSNGELVEQQVLKSILHRGNWYKVCVCHCGGRKHVNRVLSFSAATSRKYFEVKAPGVLSGRSLFGQRLPHLPPELVIA